MLDIIYAQNPEYFHGLVKANLLSLQKVRSSEYCNKLLITFSEKTLVTIYEHDPKLTENYIQETLFSDNADIASNSFHFFMVLLKYKAQGLYPLAKDLAERLMKDSRTLQNNFAIEISYRLFNRNASTKEQ